MTTRKINTLMIGYHALILVTAIVFLTIAVTSSSTSPSSIRTGAPTLTSSQR